MQQTDINAYVKTPSPHSILLLRKKLKSSRAVGNSFSDEFLPLLSVSSKFDHRDTQIRFGTSSHVLGEFLQHKLPRPTQTPQQQHIMRGRGFSCQRLLTRFLLSKTTTTTSPKAALAGQRHHHLSSKAVGLPKADWKTKSSEEQETERSLRVRKSALCESTTESKTHQNILLKSSWLFFGALRDAQNYNALIKPLVFVRYKHGKNKNKKKGGKNNTSSSDDDSDNNTSDDDDDEDDDDRNGKEEGGSGAEDDATLTPFTVASVERETAKALENLKLELGKLRTSRASTGVVENIMIANIYESSAPPVPLKSLGAITVRDAKTISIALYDNSEPNKNAVENAIVNEKHLKFGAKKDESGVLVSLPEMDANARKEVVKMAQELGEKSKIGVRRARKKAIDAVKKQTYTLKLFGEDEKKRFEKSIQKVHDDAIKEIDRLEKMKKEHIESGL